MFGGLPKVKLSRLVAAIILGLSCASAAHAQSSNQRPGNIVGNIDGISHDGDQTFISGWACQQGQKKSITVAIFVDRSAYETPKGTFVLDGLANLNSEPAVAQACQDQEGGSHRFVVELPSQLFANGRDRKLYVHGGRVVDGVPNAAIAGSATPLRRLPVLAMQFPGLAAFHPVSGAYRSLAEHPRVFTTAAELKDVAARINRPGSYSTERYGQLADQVTHDLAAHVDWDATYSGCDIDIYLRVFSVEARGGYAKEIRTEDQLRAANNAKPGTTAPAGAAVVASRLALYAALVKAGARVSPGAPAADRAAALAKRILLAWSARGFRDEHGAFLNQSRFCDSNGKSINPGLHLSRGIVYSVHAQDLLAYLGALDETDLKQLDGFHAALYDVIRRAHNNEFSGPHPACERYANGQSVQLASLLAMARLLDDRAKFNAALSGADPAIPVLLPWMVFFDHTLYGEGDSPLECGVNTGPDSLTSHPLFVTATVAPGEIQDRYRNLGTLQGIGYPMGTLRGLIGSAEILRIAGFDPYSYRGTHKQSIEMAIDYYACLAAGAGFYKIVTAENSGACANAAQYYGKLVNDVDRAVVFGAYRFPKDPAITRVEAAAKVASRAFPLDTLVFGRWRD